MADLKFDVDYSDLSRSLDVLMKMGKASKNTATAFEQSFRQIKRWQDTFKGQQGKINAQLEATHQKLQLANKSAKSSAQAFIAHEKAIQDNTNALNRMKMSYDASYAVEQRTLQLKKLLRQEIANGNMTVRQAGAELVKYRKQVVAFNQVQMAATKASNRMGVVTQQAGYQVSDFIVQVQSGTNPFVAFSQQASQLAGVLPLVAGNLGLTTTAAIGLSAALGIAIPILGAIGAAIWTTGKNAASAKTEVDNYTQSITDLTSAVRDWTRESAFLYSNEKEVKLFVAKREQNDLILKLSQLTNGAINANNYLSLLGDNEAFKTKAVEAGINAEKASEAVEVFKKLAKITDEISTGEAALKGLENQREADRIAQDALDVLEDLARKDKERLEEQKRINDSAKEELRILQQENALLQIRKQFGDESLAAKELEKLNAVENFELELRRAGVAEDTVEGLSEQLKLSLDLTEELKEQAKQAQELKKQVQEVSRSYGKMLQKRALADVFDPRGESGMSATKALRLGVDLFANDDDDGDRETTGGGKSTKEILADLQKQINLEKYLVDASDARKRVVQAVGETYARNNPQTIEGLTEQIQAIKDIEAQEAKRIKALEEAAQKQKEMQDFISQSFESGFMSIIDGTQSVKDAFRSMARDIIAELMRVFVVKKAISALTGVPFADGGVFQGGSQVQAFANGGVVGGPTFFPMSGGKTGLMGEAGPEAIMPLKRGKNGKLGVEASGESGNVTVVQNFSFSANGDDSVKKIIAQEAPKIAQMTQQQILESRKRGGSFRKAFG